MMQNLVWATAYNVIAIPAAARAFMHWGITLPMSLWGALVMNPLDCNRGGERAVSTSFETLPWHSYAAWCALRPVGNVK